MDVVSYTDPWHGKRGDFAGCCGDFHRFIDWLEPILDDIWWFLKVVDPQNGFQCKILQFA